MFVKTVLFNYIKIFNKELIVTQRVTNCLNNIKKLNLLEITVLVAKKLNVINLTF